MRIVIPVWLTCCVILALIGLRFRVIANSYFYIECAYLILVSFVPEQGGSSSSQVLCFQVLAITVTLGCQPRVSIFIALFLYGIIEFIQVPFVNTVPEETRSLYWQIIGFLVIFLTSVASVTFKRVFTQKNTLNRQLQEI